MLQTLGPLNSLIQDSKHFKVMTITPFLKSYVLVTCVFSELSEKTRMLREEVVKCLRVTRVTAAAVCCSSSEARE